MSYKVDIYGDDKLKRAMERYGELVPKARRKILYRLGSDARDKAERLAKARVTPGIGLAGHYAEQFIADFTQLDHGYVAVENDAKNPLYKNFPYAVAIETGHLRRYKAPLVLGGQPSALGLWAEDKLGFQWDEMSKVYVTPDGRRLTRMNVQMPPYYPMRDASLSIERTIPKIIDEIMKELME